MPRKKNDLNVAVPKVTASTTIAIDKEVHTAQYQYGPTDLKKEVMDEITKLIGDGNAKVSVSADFGIKDFGTGASAMATVSLTCNQDTKTIEQAAKIAGDLARDLAQEQRQRAENELNVIIAERGARSGSPRY